MKKVISQVNLATRWSMRSNKTPLPSGSSSGSSSGTISLNPAGMMQSGDGIRFGSCSIAGKYHKNEDYLVEASSLGETVAIESMSRQTSPARRTDSCEAKFDDDEPPLALNIDDLYFTAVFDGHGGGECSSYMGSALKAHIAQLLTEFTFTSFQDFCVSPLVSEAFKLCEEDFMVSYENSPAGACVAMAIIHENDVLLAWLGDCRVVMYSGNDVLALTTDHRTTNHDEFKRVIQNGGMIINDRVMGILSPTRAFGDNDVKKRFPNTITAEPSVLCFSIDEDNVPSDTSFLILATDGVFDAMTNERACEIVSKSLVKNSDVEEAANRLADAAARANPDDVTVSLVVWNHKQRLARSATRRY